MRSHPLLARCVVAALALLALRRAAFASGDAAPTTTASAAAANAEGIERVSFDEALRRALAQNATGRIAEQEIVRAEALVREAQAAWLPQLAGVAAYARLDGARVAQSANGGTNQLLGRDTINISAQLSVPLLAPRSWLASQRAKIGVDAATFTQADVRRQLALAAGRTYLAVVAAHRQLEVAGRAEQNAKEHDDYARLRLTGGLGNRLDQVRAAQDLATTEVTTRNQLVALSRAREALGVVLAADAPLDTDGVPTLPAPPALSAALDAARSRSDIAAAGARLRIADKAVDDTWSFYAPLLNATFAPYAQTPATSTIPTTGWAATLVLSVPFYDGGLRYGQIRETRALAAEAKEQLAAQLRQAGSEVRAAFEALLHSDEALSSARRAAELARESLKLAEDAFHAGAVTNLDVLDASRRLRDVESDEANAEDASRQARLELLAAAGKLP